MANADSATHSETFAGLLCRSGDSQFVIPRPSVNLILDVAVTASTYTIDGLIGAMRGFYAG